MNANIFHRLWSDETGFILSLEIILLGIILVFGLVVGMQVLRDSLAQELGDLGMGIGSINNSFTITGIAGPVPVGGGVSSGVSGSLFSDALDANDTPFPVSGAVSGGLLLGQAPISEL
ncbi:MAG: hypothetical protein JNM18_09655 [Planctomycetaceae bacterium]|nr:hypothetical protein [Planctomycetaceae bacterium]